MNENQDETIVNTKKASGTGNPVACRNLRCPLQTSWGTLRLSTFEGAAQSRGAQEQNHTTLRESRQEWAEASEDSLLLVLLSSKMLISG